MYSQTCVKRQDKGDIKSDNIDMWMTQTVFVRKGSADQKIESGIIVFWHFNATQFNFLINDYELGTK